MDPHTQALAIVGGAFGILAVITFVLLLILRQLHIRNEAEALRREQERP